MHNFLGSVHIFLCMWEVGKPEERGRGRDQGERKKDKGEGRKAGMRK